MTLPDEEPLGLIDLLDQLRQNGFHIGTEQYIAAMKLAVLLKLRDDLKDQPQKLGAFLAPVLCATPEQQANFPKYFERWLTSNSTASGVAKSVVQKPPPTPSSTVTVKLKSVWRRFAPPQSFWVLLAALIISGLVAILYRQQPVQRTLTVHLINAPGPVTLQVVSPDIETVKSVERSTTVTYYTLPVVLKIETAGSPVFMTRIDSDVESITVDMKSLQSASVPASPMPQQNWVVQNNKGWISLAIVLFLGLLFLVLRRIRKSRRQLELRKERTKQPLKTQPLSVKGAGEQVTQLLSLRRTAQELRRHRLVKSTELETNQTINATLRRGLFSPTYTSRKSSPEYLVLIDRASLDDQRARLATEIMDRLIRNGVFVTTYYFDGDPRLCRAARLTEGNWSLPDLAARHPDHTLMIFGEGTELFDPIGTPHHWVEMFSPWSNRFLLSSDIRRGDYRQWALRQVGFEVVTADGKGMMTLGEIVHAGVRRAGSESPTVKPLPELLRTRQDRWTEEHPPLAEVLKELCLQLREFLGEEGVYWLSACAVYPKLYWDLALYLGCKLINTEGFDQKFSMLLRLPWFRHGNMPDWLREPLVASLPGDKERAVRKALEDLLISSLENPDGFILPIASKSEASQNKSSNETLRRRLRTPWRRRELVTEQLRKEAGETPLRDYVLVDFLKGHKPNRLATAVPSEIRDLLYPKKPQDTTQAERDVVSRESFLPKSRPQQKGRRPAKLRLLAVAFILIPVALYLLGFRGSQDIVEYITVLFGGLLLLLLTFIRLPQVQSDDEPPMSTLQKLTGVFYAPSRVFRNLRAHPEWLIALVVLVVVNGIYLEVFVRRVTAERITDHTIERMPTFPASPDQLEIQRQILLRRWQQPQQRLKTVGTGLVGYFIIYTFVAALCLLVVTIFRSRLNFWQALSACIYSSLPGIIISKSLSLVILFIKAPDDINPTLGQVTLVNDHLGILVSPSDHPVLYIIGTSFGLLAFYGFWLKAKALANVGYSVTAKAAWGATIVLWMLWLAWSVLIASMLPGSVS